VTIEANHRRGDQVVAHRSDQEQLRLFRELARDVGVWVVPWARKAALLPEGDNGWLVVRSKGSYLHMAGDAQWYWLNPIGCFRTNCGELFTHALIHRSADAQQASVLPANRVSKA
jgi:hypothetical protein